MGALVVYESLFGNGAAVARAVAEGLGATIEVEVVAIADAPDEVPADVDLLVVGAPNHRFGLPTESSRREAAERGAPPATAPTGARDWVRRVRLPMGTPVAVWDTRLVRPKLLGTVDHAADTLRRRLHQHGGRPVGEAHFRVADVDGPLLDGETDRARRWGATLAACLPSRGTLPG